MGAHHLHNAITNHGDSEMKVKIKINDASLSANVIELDEVWSLIIPAMMASGYCYETAKDSLYDWMESNHSEFLAEHSEPKDSEEDSMEDWGAEYDNGYTDGYNGEEPVSDSKAYRQGHEDGERAYEEESGSESESESQSTCGND